MRVLFIGSNRGGGGTESHFISLARALSDAGHEVIAAVCADEFIHRGLACDARIRLLPVEFRSRRDVRAIRDLIRIMRRERPDWVVGAFKAEYWGIAFAAKAADVPLVLFSHLDQHIRPWMLGRLMRLVRAVIVPSEYLRRRTIERGLPPARVIVLPNPIDVDRFRPDAALRAEVRSSLGLRPDDVLLGYVGRFEPEKGVETHDRVGADGGADLGEVERHALVGRAAAGRRGDSGEQHVGQHVLERRAVGKRPGQVDLGQLRPGRDVAEQGGRGAVGLA